MASARPRILRSSQEEGGNHSLPSSRRCHSHRPLPTANRKRKCVATASDSLGRIIRTEAAQTSLVAVNINVLRLRQLLNIFTTGWHVQASKITGCLMGTSGHTVPRAAAEVHLPCLLSRLVSKTTVLHTLGLHRNYRPTCTAPLVQPCTLLGSRKSREGPVQALQHSVLQSVSHEHPLHLQPVQALQHSVLQSVQALQHSVVRVGTSGHTLPEKPGAAAEVHLPCLLSHLVNKTTVLMNILGLHRNYRPTCKAPAVQPCTLLGSRKNREGKLSRFVHHSPVSRPLLHSPAVAPETAHGRQHWER